MLVFYINRAGKNCPGGMRRRGHRKLLRKIQGQRFPITTYRCVSCGFLEAVDRIGVIVAVLRLAASLWEKPSQRKSE
jgi:hypothetical protein